MSHPNPFANNVPAQTAQPAAPAQQQAPNNPFAQQAAPAAPQQAPQAYAPQQQAPAAGNPFAQQQAAPAPQAYAPQQTGPGLYGQPHAPTPSYVPPQGVTHEQHVANTYQQQQAPPALGTASAPPPPVSGGGKGAKLADMYGRLVVIFPMMLQRVPKNAKFVTDADRQSGNLEQDRMTATVVVLDGGRVGDMTAIGWGGNPHGLPPTPHTDYSPLPYVRKGMWLNQSQLIGQCSPYLPGRERGGPNGAPGAVVGRLVKTGPQQNDPWFITTPTDDELNLANQYLQLVSAGQFPHPLAP
jgi:hypothetical protein